MACYLIRHSCEGKPPVEIIRHRIDAAELAYAREVRSAVESEAMLDRPAGVEAQKKALVGLDGADYAEVTIGYHKVYIRKV